MLKTILTRSLALALATITFANAQSAPGTPIFVQPPQQQTPEVVPTVPQIVTPPPVTPVALPQPTPDRFTVWGGVGTELYVLPGVLLGASAPIGHLGGVNLALRASAEAVIVPVADLPGPLPFVNVDLLLSGSGRGLRAYGGPSVGTIPGFAILLGGVGGVRGDFGAGPWGYFAETKARVAFGAAGGSGAMLVLPGVNLGITYRF
ncbi:hypothetical protein [Deinococcus humi]|uniref:Outer membrane protein beta-barrel domain-containing protein n=1 Tax=Deinococcus humi TaxID=662880 RepID=A0A7W8NDK2_9DEIO|nr:hypothetical protein [Deinococcus humi]MBB5361695.1 hypothetical protein [Deinococcus humi]GGO24165.1 hypothetical protein GCM10008949_13010 [Deinococcus humi]